MHYKLCRCDTAIILSISGDWRHFFWRRDQRLATAVSTSSGPNMLPMMVAWRLSGLVIDLIGGGVNLTTNTRILANTGNLFAALSRKVDAMLYRASFMTHRVIHI